MSIFREPPSRSRSSFTCTEYLTWQKQLRVFHDRLGGRSECLDLKEMKVAAAAAATRPGLQMRDRHTSYTNTHTCARVHVLPTKASICTAIRKSQVTGTLHIEYCFQREVWDSDIQESEPLVEVKRLAGGDRWGSRPSIGRHRSSSMCRATSMVSSRSNSPSWSRAESGLVERGGCQRELACLTAPRTSHQSRGTSSGWTLAPPPAPNQVSWSLALWEAPQSHLLLLY